METSDEKEASIELSSLLSDGYDIHSSELMTDSAKRTPGIVVCGQYKSGLTNEKATTVFNEGSWTVEMIKDKN